METMQYDAHAEEMFEDIRRSGHVRTVEQVFDASRDARDSYLETRAEHMMQDSGSIFADWTDLTFDVRDWTEIIEDVLDRLELSYDDVYDVDGPYTCTD